MGSRTNISSEVEHLQQKAALKNKKAKQLSSKMTKELLKPKADIL